MSKIIAIAILTIMTFVPVVATRTSTLTLPPNNEMGVMVLFSGLMVFNFNKEKQAYEVGILNDDSGSHEFCVQRQGATRLCRGDSEFSTGAKWSLTGSTSPGGSPVALGQGKNLGLTLKTVSTISIG